MTNNVTRTPRKNGAKHLLNYSETINPEAEKPQGCPCKKIEQFWV
jgi:hypothetical protein